MAAMLTLVAVRMAVAMIVARLTDMESSIGLPTKRTTRRSVRGLLWPRHAVRRSGLRNLHASSTPTKVSITSIRRVRSAARCRHELRSAVTQFRQFAIIPNGGEALPVGRLAFKAREGRQTALSGFDSHSLPPILFRQILVR